MEQKYLKYKEKYLKYKESSRKNQRGGAWKICVDDECENDEDGYDSIVRMHPTDDNIKIISITYFSNNKSMDVFIRTNLYVISCDVRADNVNIVIGGAEDLINYNQDPDTKQAFKEYLQSLIEKIKEKYKVSESGLSETLRGILTQINFVFTNLFMGDEINTITRI